MRLALISEGIAPYVMGGIQRHSFNLARHLARLGIEIDLYHTALTSALNIDGLEGMTTEEKSRINSMSIPWNRRESLPGHYLRELAAFSREALDRLNHRSSVDFIYAQGLAGSAFVAARSRGALNVPAGVNLHGLEMFQPAPSWRAVIYNPLFRRAARRQLRHADHVFAFGGRIRTLLDRERAKPKRVIEIPNAIPGSWLRDAPKPRDSDVRRFLFIGRYERRKGIEELNEALLSWSGKLPCGFEFVGPIPPEKQLSHQEITYHGPVNNHEQLKAILDGCDVLVCPSHAEGMPTVILEAMARGLAIIATDVGAVSVMVGADNGILLPGPNVHLIRRAIERIATLPEAELDTMKRASLVKVQQFTWDKVARMTLDAISARLD